VTLKWRLPDGKQQQREVVLEERRNCTSTTSGLD